MNLTKYQRTALMGTVASFLIERIIAEAQDIVYEGITLEGLNNYSDQDLLNEYYYYQGLDVDKIVESEDRLYQECIAQLAIEDALGL
jgi:hypothetical protein